MYEDDYDLDYGMCDNCKRVELTEYEKEFRALIDKAFSEKHSEILNDKESYKKRYEASKYAVKTKDDQIKYMQEGIERLRSEISDLQRGNEEIEKEAFEKALKKLTGGLKPGDYVYARYNSSEYRICTQCEKGFINVEKNSIKLKAKCPFCNSNGRINNNVSKVVKMPVTSINFYHYKDGDGNNKVKISIDSNGTAIKKYFETEEECQKECDEKNKIEEERVEKLLAGELPEDDDMF